MKLSRNPLAASLFAAASFTTIASTSHAATALTTFTETADAGQTLKTAAATASTAAPAGSPLTTIFGSLSTASDADLYAITISTPSTFSASTVNSVTGTSGLDTALFLFNASGVAIATNDDASGGASVDSSLPSGNTLYANLMSGVYYLGIGSSGNEAINSASQLLFAGYPGGDTTAVRGTASGLNPTTLSTFNSNEFDTTTSGAYEIDLTSTATAANPAVPEPSTWAAFVLGGIAAGFAILRRRVA